MIAWTCVCGAKLEAGPEAPSGATLVVEFTDLHWECPATWRARWYPERETTTVYAQAERTAGFEIPDSGDVT